MTNFQKTERSFRSDKRITNIVHLRQLVQVKKCRALGCATVDLVNLDGSIKNRDKTVVVQFPAHVHELAKEGSIWEVSGKEYIKQFSSNGFVVNEYVIYSDDVKFIRPRRKLLARWLSANIDGIGSVTAQRLIRVKNLDAIIENRDKAVLLEIPGMSEERIELLFEGWPAPSFYETIDWLDSFHLPLNLGEKLVAILGSGTIDKIKSHPFLLMAMGVPYKKTMEVVRIFGLSIDDKCVLAGVALHVAIKYSTQTGSTVISREILIKKCEEITKSDIPEIVGDIAVQEGLLIRVGNAYQVYGKALMESSVAQFLVNSYRRPAGAESQLAMWELGLTKLTVETALTSYESSLGFTLTEEQRDAVTGAIFEPVCCISGGAGTGKTTILKAVLGIYEQIAQGVSCYQVALSGRAAQKMASATGRASQTIAKLIASHLGERKSKLPSHILLVIDEASMVDLTSMYRLISILPKATRILFVGDASQLPPVGEGLIFHALFNTRIPFFNLSQVKRQNQLSSIHRFAMSIRDSKVVFPQLTKSTLETTDECSVVPNQDVSRLIDLWHEAGGIKNIVLSPIKKGTLGVDNINRLLQQAVGLSRSQLYYLDEMRGWIPWITSDGMSLLEGDPVLTTSNNYDINADFRNGDLGVITEIFKQSNEKSEALGVLEVNGKAVIITAEILSKLELGYSITIHKSQGSEWPTCFVMLPSEASRMIDQTLLYTAVTRSTDRLILMGDVELIERAVNRGSIALERRTTLRERLYEIERVSY